MYRSRSKHALQSAEGAIRNKKPDSRFAINSFEYIKMCKESRNRLKNFEEMKSLNKRSLDRLDRIKFYPKSNHASAMGQVNKEIC